MRSGTSHKRKERPIYANYYLLYASVVSDHSPRRGSLAGERESSVVLPGSQLPNGLGASDAPYSGRLPGLDIVLIPVSVLQRGVATTRGNQRSNYRPETLAPGLFRSSGRVRGFPGVQSGPQPGGIEIFVVLGSSHNWPLIWASRICRLIRKPYRGHHDRVRYWRSRSRVLFKLAP